MITGERGIKKSLLKSLT